MDDLPGSEAAKGAGLWNLTCPECYQRLVAGAAVVLAPTLDGAQRLWHPHCRTMWEARMDDLDEDYPGRDGDGDGG